MKKRNKERLIDLSFLLVYYFGAITGLYLFMTRIACMT